MQLGLSSVYPLQCELQLTAEYLLGSSVGLQAREPKELQGQIGSTPFHSPWQHVSWFRRLAFRVSMMTLIAPEVI